MNKVKSPFDIHHITGRVYLFLFDDMFDLCMHFLRYQEYYESPEFHGKNFTIIEFMEWYSKTFGKGVFTYPNDWGGFNIPSNVIWKVHTNSIPDYNKYDGAMLEAYNKISSNTQLVAGCTKYDNFYILGACKTHLGVLGHELAHGLYATSDEYRDEITKCAMTLPDVVVKRMFEYLLKIGYTQHVLEDELQAYMATGVPTELMKDKVLVKHTAPFKNIFNKYTKQIKFNASKTKPLQLQ